MKNTALKYLSFKISPLLLAPLFLTGCMGSMMKRAEMHQQALQEISSALAYEAFVPMESSFRSAPAEELSPGVYKVLNADKIEPKKTFRPTALEDSLVVARMSDPRQFEKVKNIDKKKLDMVFPRGALVTVLYLKNLKTGTYFNLHPEGFSVDSWEVSPEGKFLAYIQDHGLYLQNLAGESLRKLIFSGAVALPAQTGRIFAQSSFDAVYKFSPDGKYLAYIDPLKGLFLLSLQEPYQATALAVDISGKDVDARLIFNASGNYLFCATGKEQHLYDIRNAREISILTKGIAKEMEKGRGWGTGLAMAALGSSVEDRVFDFCDLSPDGRYGLFSIYSQVYQENTSGGSGMNSVSNQNATATTTKRLFWTPEKNILVDINTGEVRRLFGFKADRAPIMCAHFTPDERIIYDGKTSQNWEDYDIFSIYDLRPLSKAFETSEEKMENLVQTSQVTFSKGIKPKAKYGAGTTLSSNGRYLAWYRKDDAFSYASLPDGEIHKVSDGRFNMFSPNENFLYYWGQKGELYRINLNQ